MPFCRAPPAVVLGWDSADGELVLRLAPGVGACLDHQRAMFRHSAFAAPQREFHQLWRIEVFVQTAPRLDGDFRLGEGQGHVINGLSRSVGTIFGDASKIGREVRSEEHTSELQSLLRSSYAVYCLKKYINII